MSLQLRDYQEEALAKIAGPYERGVRRQLVALPTGVGAAELLTVAIARRRA